MKTRNILIPFVLAGLVACGDDSDSKDSSNFDNTYNGVWTSETTGVSYKIENNEVETYQHNSQFCLLEDEADDVQLEDLNAIFEMNSDGQSITDYGVFGIQSFHAPGHIYNKIKHLPAVCDTPVATIDDANYTRDPVRDFKLFWQTFNDFYVSFDLKQVDWNEQYELAIASINVNTTDEELLDVFYQMISLLKDSHVYVESDSLGRASVDGKETRIFKLINEYADANNLTLPIPLEHLEGVNQYIFSQLELVQDIILDYATDESSISSAANDNLVWFKVANTGYLQINAMIGFSNDESQLAELTALESALEQAIEDLQDTDNLVIDVRSNNGGKDFLSMAIASRFVDSQRHVYSKQARLGSGTSPLVDVYLEPRGAIQYLKPIVLLTSNSTVSAAESFSIMMRSLPQVTLMGETTQGALSDVLEKKLPNGFEMGLSFERYYSVDGEWFEDVGVPVAIEVPYMTLEQRANEEDLGLENAYDFLNNL